MATPETRQDGQTSTQKLRAMQQTRPTMTFPNAGPQRFVQRFLKEVPNAPELARLAAGPGSVPPGQAVPEVTPPAPSSPPPSIVALRRAYEQVKASPHTLSVDEVEELHGILGEV